MNLQSVDLYSDGSFCVKTGRASWGFLIIQNDQIIHQETGILEGEINKMRQIGGEIFGVIKGIEYCKENNYKATIYHDYSGLFFWCADFWGQKAWQAKNEWTRKYRIFVAKNIDYIEKYIHVRGHADSVWNNRIDEILVKARENSVLQVSE